MKHCRLIIICVALAAWVGIMQQPLAGQDVEPITQEVVEGKVKKRKQDMSLLDLYFVGGFLMHPILLCSIGTIAVAAFCGSRVSKNRMAPEVLIKQLDRLMASRDVDGAFQICRATPNFLTRCLMASLVKANFDRDMYNKPAMEEAAAQAIANEETKQMLWINYLNVFATIAPMLGLLGTVTGMIQAFNQLAAGRSEVEDLTAGIGEAMITTAGGLFVGIPAMFCFFFFRNKLLGAITHIQTALTQMLDLFTGEVTLQE